MVDEPIRIGFVGAGDNTKVRHLPGFKAIDGVELVSVANRSRQSGQAVADRFGISTVYDNWAELIAAPDTNAICIGTWPNMHRILVLAALDAGKHVLSEARMAMNAREARDMLDATRTKPHLVAQVVPSAFTFRVESTVLDLIGDGYLGDLMAADLVIQSGFIDRDAPLTWRNDRDMSGYNIMLMGAWYECVMPMVGSATSVTAVTRTYVSSRRAAGGGVEHITIPDHVEVICETASGAVLHIRVSVVMGLAPPPDLWLYGSEGTMHLVIATALQDFDSVRLFGGKKGDGELREIDVPPEKVGGWRVEEEFVNAIRGKELVTHTTFEDGVRYMEFTEAVTRSARTGKRVYLPL